MQVLAHSGSLGSKKNDQKYWAGQPSPPPPSQVLPKYDMTRIKSSNMTPQNMARHKTKHTFLILLFPCFSFASKKFQINAFISAKE
jgi:hypothetical protein